MWGRREIGDIYNSRRGGHKEGIYILSSILANTSKIDLVYIVVFS